MKTKVGQIEDFYRWLAENRGVLVAAPLHIAPGYANPDRRIYHVFVIGR